MTDHKFDDHTAQIATSTVLRALNSASATKDFSAESNKQFATAIATALNDETVKRSIARILVQEIDYLRDTDPEKHLPHHHTRTSILKLD
ncbi:hypothetical protein FD04_GL000940 [Secundilactobacillus odoratitofui DSM 19909 = JCM 15043]|uniref:Uncharacterized protein n=1 Tax=Secundilactobacillus odoratitofui DSM 19909 = JCM 15043 TaxID=1423776 RepID=A0A0R1LQ21_9LACO|nr:hypothetical protein [Secundilactobacillus odoratitofui]KRK97964.1 hypothetical protein FD04_GL000940 [Secundilactobacillus odoratitofui DSM 19909 = JCM 15043]